MCICGMFTAAGTQTVLAGPADGFEAEMVAKVEAADISIYAEENEGSEVVAMAQKGGIYDVVESGSDGWVRVTAEIKKVILRLTELYWRKPMRRRKQRSRLRRHRLLKGSRLWIMHFSS